MAANRQQIHPEDPNSFPAVNPRVCANTLGCCGSCIINQASPYICTDEIRRIGCCGNFPCDSQHPTALAKLQHITNLPTLAPYAPPNQFRFAAYRHLVCHAGFGEVYLPDPQRQILSCCLLLRVRCTWPLPTAHYNCKGHVTIAGYLPIVPM